MLARLQAESSRNMYSEQGLRGVDPPGVRAGVPAVDGRVVLQARIAAGPGRLGHRGEHLAGRVASARPCSGSVTQWVVQGLSASTASMNSSLTRTERLAFWKRTES